MMTERQQVESSTAWRPPQRMSGGRRLTGGKAVREAAGLMQIAAGGDLASQRQERVGRGIEVPDREVRGRPSARPCPYKPTCFNTQQKKHADGF